jgi:hypothetical protein
LALPDAIRGTCDVLEKYYKGKLENCLLKYKLLRVKDDQAEEKCVARRQEFRRR